MSVTGLILRLTYGLRRHLLLGWTLARWLGWLLAAIGIWALIRGWPNPWLALVIGVTLVLYIAILIWAQRAGFVRYQRLPDEERQLQDIDLSTPLRKEELVSARATGWFTVEGQDQYFVDIEADFETVGTREHIVLGRVYRSRFLWLGGWPGYELGWWYIFFEPAMIRKVDLGELAFGPEPQRALRLVYDPGDESWQTVYLVIDDKVALSRVWRDLLRDAPPGVAG